MLKKIIYNLNKLSFIFIIFLFLNIKNSYAESLKKFLITGNDRISNETIILFSGYNIDDNINESDLNMIIKNYTKQTFLRI